MLKNWKFIAMTFAGLGILASCQKDFSGSTGWAYNDPSNGGFQKVPFVDQETGPGLIMIEGGTFTMGRAEKDVTFEWNNVPRRVTVSSFYMDQFEVTNFYWLEYLHWVRRTYITYPEIYKNALPDTNCWRSPLAFNEKYVENYLRHPAYRDYPVVGVSWLQANDFCKWRTDRVNEYILVREGIFEQRPDQSDAENFNTDAYLSGQYDYSYDEEGVNEGGKLTNLDPNGGTQNAKGRMALGKRHVRIEDGILLPRYRLPTEAEWEFAYYGLIGNLENPNAEVITQRRLYPWNGHWVRNDNEEFQGDIRANFVRGRGDYMGVAGNLNDNADVTAPVDMYWPNDYGLYHMAGNVSEWVMDVYRPMSLEDFNEFRPFRGNVFKSKVLNNEGTIDRKTPFTIYDVHGMKSYLNEFERIRYQRISAAKHDPNDTLIATGVERENFSKNPVRTHLPDEYFVSHNRVKDSLELDIILSLNRVLDSAINTKNDKFLIEASEIVEEEIMKTILADEYRAHPVSGEEYTFEIIPMLRRGFSDYIINTPGKLKWREVRAEENIRRRNYRDANYIDEEDGDIESSIHYNNDVRKGKINEYRRDDDLVMYQSKHEQFGLDGAPVKPEGITSWPTTLISDKSRVYKGGSWKDRAYWLVGGTRRYLDEDLNSDAIGFRCAMDRLGSPRGLGAKYNKKKK